MEPVVFDDERNITLREIQKHVKESQEQKDNEILFSKVDNLEQYSRSECITIYGVPTEVNESSENVKSKVKTMIEVAGMDIPNGSIDRAHRIGDIKNNRLKTEQNFTGEERTPGKQLECLTRRFVNLL